MQEFLKLPEHTKEVIEGLLKPATDSTQHAPMKNSKSNTKIPVAKIFFEASMVRFGDGRLKMLSKL